MGPPNAEKPAPARPGNGLHEIEMLGSSRFSDTAVASHDQQVSDARLRLLARRLHALGERPLLEFLREVIAGCDPIARLEVYAALDAEVLAALNGRELPVVLFSVEARDAA